MNFLEGIAHNFERIQAAILVIGIGMAAFFMKNKSGPSQFRHREADREDLNRILKQGPDLAQAKLKRNPKNPPPPPPLSLPGIRMEGAPHEILGVSENAGEAEIMKAYKDAIKRFHPDTIQGQAKDQIRFYQEASARINDAKNLMIKNLKRR